MIAPSRFLAWLLAPVFALCSFNLLADTVEGAPQAPLLIQYVIIGVTMVCVDLIVMAGYTGLASKVLRMLRTPKQQRRMNRTFAGLFIGAAAFMATLRKAAV